MHNRQMDARIILEKGEKQCIQITDFFFELDSCAPQKIWILLFHFR